MSGTKTCIRCGAPFQCGMSAGETSCWCAELPPIMPVTDEGCLCRKCLEQEVGRRVCGEATPRAAVAVVQAGLCAGCANARTLETKGGSPVYLCRLSDEDSSYAKYPRLPTLECAGYRAR